MILILLSFYFFFFSFWSLALSVIWPSWERLIPNWKGCPSFSCISFFFLWCTFFFSMFASHRSQRSRIFLTPITLLNPENTIKLTSNTTFKNIKSLYIDTKLTSFGRKTYRSQFGSVYLFPNLLPWWSFIKIKSHSSYTRFIFPYISIKQQKG